MRIRGILLYIALERKHFHKIHLTSLLALVCFAKFGKRYFILKCLLLAIVVSVLSPVLVNADGLQYLNVGKRYWKQFTSMGKTERTSIRVISRPCLRGTEPLITLTDPCMLLAERIVNYRVV